MSFSSLLRAAADLLWVPRCAACEDHLGDTGFSWEEAVFCPSCATSLVPVDGSRCPRCGVAFEDGGPSHLCGHCLAAPPPFEAIFPRYAYGGALAGAVSRFKYGPAPHLGAPLSRLLFEGQKFPEEIELVVPMPLHPRRLRRRGFNQAALLLAHVPKELRGRRSFRVLERVVDTPHQAGQGRRARLEALSNAFCATPSRTLEGARVLLVDDVVTTGATMGAASAALLAAGASRVYGLCLARAM